MSARLAKQVGKTLRSRGVMLATAESCTGGGVAHAVTKVAGSSAWFDRAFVTYSNIAKEEMLGVATDTLQLHGAVSEQTVREMVAGALKNSHAQVAVAVSGIAGPSGGTAEKPVGTVWFAWSSAGQTKTRCCHLTGDRDAVRFKATRVALQGVLDILQLS